MRVAGEGAPEAGNADDDAATDASDASGMLLLDSANPKIRSSEDAD